MLWSSTSDRTVHHSGGSCLGSSRGGFDIEKTFAFLDRNEVDMLFVVGGDGTHRAALKIMQHSRDRMQRAKDAGQALGSPGAPRALAVAGIPKTIDNDIDLIDRSFGFNTAVEEAVRAIRSAKTEARWGFVLAVVGSVGEIGDVEVDAPVAAIAPPRALSDPLILSSHSPNQQLRSQRHRRCQAHGKARRVHRRPRVSRLVRRRPLPPARGPALAARQALRLSSPPRGGRGEKGVFRFVSFRFVSFRFVSFRSVSFRFVPFRFVSFRFVSFRFVSFRFVSLRRAVFLLSHSRSVLSPHPHPHPTPSPPQGHAVVVVGEGAGEAYLRGVAGLVASKDAISVMAKGNAALAAKAVAAPSSSKKRKTNSGGAVATGAEDSLHEWNDIDITAARKAGGGAAFAAGAKDAGGNRVRLSKADMSRGARTAYCRERFESCGDGPNNHTHAMHTLLQPRRHYHPSEASSARSSRSTSSAAARCAR